MNAPLDLTGETFGHIFVVSKTTERYNGNIIYLCHCDNCDSDCYLTTRDLRSFGITSCGCIPKEKKVIQREQDRLGISWSKEKKQWEAYIYHDDEYSRLGYYDNYKDALKERRDAKKMESSGLLGWYLEERKK